MLRSGQQPLSNRFAQHNAARFEGVDWSVRFPDGSPILGGALASFDCRTYACRDGGAHVMFVG